MALATRCPHCHTTFRVAHDQLKLRAGLVRCGACKQIFNGVENLVPIEDLQPPAVSASTPTATASTPGPASTSVPPSASIASRDAKPAPSQATSAGPANTGAENSRFMPIPQWGAGAEPASGQTGTERDPGFQPAHGGSQAEDKSAIDPLLRMTLLDFAPLRRRSADKDTATEDAPAPDMPDPIEKAIADLQGKPLRGEAASREAEVTSPHKYIEKARQARDAEETEDGIDIYEEPLFMQQGRRRQRIGRKLHLAMTIGCVALSILLLAQVLYISRGQIAASFPQSRPILADLCASLGCRIPLPAQIEAVSIESSELQVLNQEANSFMLTTLLRNRSATPQAWPNIELTLTDASDKAISRRVFTARDYLPGSANLERGFGPRSEQPVKIYFQLSQLKAAGYRVYLFYP